MIFLYFLLAGTLGGTTGSLIKYAAQEMPPLQLVFLRLGLSVLLFLPFVLKFKIRIHKNQLKLVLLSSTFLLSNIVLFSVGVQYTSAIMSQLIYVPTSVLVALFGYFLLKEKLKSNQIFGLFITILGMSLLAYGSINTSDIFSFGKPVGNLLITIGLFSWALYFTASRSLVKTLSPLSVSFINTAVAFVLSAFLIPLDDSKLTWNFSTATQIALLASVVTSVAFLFLSQNLIKKTSAFTASLITYINPIAATAWGIFLFREKPVPGLILSGLLVFVGVFIATTYNYAKGSK
jgi:drug/metabolite transporter (DMT)-like permease